MKIRKIFWGNVFQAEKSARAKALGPGENLNEPASLGNSKMLRRDEIPEMAVQVWRPDR